MFVFTPGVQCYQNGLKTKVPNMTLENFKRIVSECRGKTYQLAFCFWHISTQYFQHKVGLQGLLYCQKRAGVSQAILNAYKSEPTNHSQTVMLADQIQHILHQRLLLLHRMTDIPRGNGG